MTRFALDTSVASEIFQRQNDRVLEWLNDTADERLFLPMPAFGELLRYAEGEDLGVETIRARREQLDEVLGLFAILEADRRVFAQWARITANLPGTASDRAGLHMDALIAATGLVHDMEVATTNTRDFRHFTRFGVRLYNPSDYRRSDLD